MRLLLFLPLCITTGCWRYTAEPAPVELSKQVAPIKSHAEPARSSTGLYTDDEIRKLADFDIDEDSRNKGGLLNMRGLDVVPNGESHPREKVFKALKLDDNRIRDFRHFGLGNVVFLVWQVSPSYDINCMTATNEPDNDGLELTDPKRKVYGIRLVRRSE